MDRSVAGRQPTLPATTGCPFRVLGDAAAPSAVEARLEIPGHVAAATIVLCWPGPTADRRVPCRCVKRAATLLAIVLASGACGGAQPTTPADPSLDVDALIGRAADAMAGLETARFTMERSGAPVEVAGLEFVSAEGQYAAPAAARALLQVRVSDLSIEVGTIAIDERVWLTNPLTGGWEEIPDGTGFNIAIVFDADVGWVPLLTDDLSDVSYLGTMDEGNGPRHVIHGSIAAVRVEFLTAGLVEAQSVESDIWIHPESGHITRVEFATDDRGAVSEWIIRLSEFDEPVTIDPPAGF